MFNFLIAIAWFLVASYMDIKTRIIHPAVPYSLMVVGIAYNYFYGSMIAMIESVAVVFAFAFILYNRGVWAGGDVKLFTALAFILPVSSVMFYPFLVLFVSLLMIFPFTIIYVFWNIIKNKLAVEHIQESLKTGAFNAIASSFILLFINILTDYRPANVFQTWIYSLIISLIFFLGLESFRASKKYVLTEDMPVALIREGDIPDGDIIVDGKKISDRKKARGLTLKEIDIIEKSGRKMVKIKKSIPFVPVMTMGLIFLYVLETLLYL
jgi:preflagellin peptidase FlaK